MSGASIDRAGHVLLPADDFDDRAPTEPKGLDILYDTRTDYHTRVARFLRYFKAERAATCVDAFGGYPITCVFFASLIVMPLFSLFQLVKLYFFVKFRTEACSLPLVWFLLAHTLVNGFYILQTPCSSPEAWIEPALISDGVMTFIGLAMLFRVDAHSAAASSAGGAGATCPGDLVSFMWTYLKIGGALYATGFLVALYLQYRMKQARAERGIEPEPFFPTHDAEDALKAA